MSQTDCSPAGVTPCVCPRFPNRTHHSRLRELFLVPQDPGVCRPGYLVAVGYLDPGNWATDIGGGSKFGYTLLSVVLISNLMAMFLQALSAKLGVVTGRDLAQACRDHYSPRVTFMLWIVCELAIAACDLAEVLGSAVALKLLFGLPLLAGVLLTSLDVLVVLALQGRGFRIIEAFVVTIIATLRLRCLLQGKTPRSLAHLQAKSSRKVFYRYTSSPGFAAWSRVSSPSFPRFWSSALPVKVKSPRY